ncbi:MAG: aminotransferase class I/II-fold pyridoxal phosphate-dependent enzyme [Gemmatimonadetes bacterium]|nr:aminotransferase class I/II-fold pyridoxal phosphate-dependent enzyme [Gemmatimonadota bacterium]MDE2679243.1 aminotransferase class I/II-fold pyridoxal phosphate-dependent enzyme [Gemmatimonadota bacterium]MYA11438.1 aminotransferase class I/II-fold pyridoxal phosphate-dependent enzyme [Gemmatimonadota bacterium]MYE93778.1 aminotransferase class I/II-fold pyridoxal phosphate-dependent enzyme [Gemmatimonadota bacterium]MYJ69629.1 aminotransferase class I/II-fold pyridoxal phosphate-dependent
MSVHEKESPAKGGDRKPTVGMTGAAPGSGGLGPGASNDLQMERDQMLQLARVVAELLVSRMDNLPGERAWEGDFKETLEEQLMEPPPEDGRPAAGVLTRAAEQILPLAARIDHPRFFGFIPASTTWPGVLADFLVAGHQVNQSTWLTSSGPSQLELVVIDWIRRWIGYPEGAGGLLTSGGSVAAITALVAAREAAGGPGRPTVYMSDQSHSAQIRAAKVVGVRPADIRLVASDSRFRLDMEALRRAVADDRAAGLNPIAVCANAGAGSTGAIDPLDEMADYCEAEGMWLHVDAAYGGFAVITDRGRRLLKGMERADSVGLDAHKWLFQPYEAGCLMVKDVSTLKDAFGVPHDMLQDTIWGAGHPNFSDRGPQVSRSVRALKIWVSVKTFGMRAFRRAVSNGMELADRAEAYIRASPTLEVLNPASLGIVCFRVNPRDGDLDEPALSEINRHVLASVFWNERAFMSSTRLHGTFSLRLCILNHTTTWDDVRETLAAIERYGEEAVAENGAGPGAG